MNPTWKARIWNSGGLLIWTIAFLVILVIATLRPENNTVTPAYRAAAEHFIARRPLYDLPAEMGYLYAPAFAFFYIPFMKLGPQLGDALWRIVSFAFASWAVMRQVRVLDTRNPIWTLSLGLLLAVALTTSVMRLGQSTLPLAAACWLLVLSVLDGKRFEIFAWAAIAFILKPIAIVVLLLAAALRPRLAVWTFLGLVVAMVVPYAVAPAGYVNSLNSDFARMLTMMSFDKATKFVPADFTATFTQFGYPLPETVVTGIRTAAAAATLALVLYFDRFCQRRVAGLAIFLAAAYYMCLFSPRTELNTYALLVLPCGLAIAFLWQDNPGRIWGPLLAAMMALASMTGVSNGVRDFFGSGTRPALLSAIALPLLLWLALGYRRSIPVKTAVAASE